MTPDGAEALAVPANETELMMRMLVSAVVVAAVALSAAPASERSIYVTVEEDGRPVTTLTASDFEVEVDGQAVPFRVEPPEISAQVLVLAENALDTRFTAGDAIRRALRTWGRVAPAGHRYALATFGQTVMTRLAFTDDPTRFEVVYGKASPQSADKKLSDAVLESVNRLAHRPGRHAILVLTSGTDTSADRTGIRLRHRLDATDIVVWVCDVGRLSGEPWGPVSAVPRAASETAHVTLSWAATSGGAAWFPTVDADIDEAMRSVANAVANQYRLVLDVSIPPDGHLHDLDVRAYRGAPGERRHRLTVHTKRGWRVEGS